MTSKVMFFYDSTGKLRVHSRMVWLWHVFYILYSLEAGIFLLFLPWMSIWENNYLLYLYPILGRVIESYFLKGAVLGLGIANLIIGIQEIAHFRQNSRHYFSR